MSLNTRGAVTECWHQTHGTSVRLQASYLCRCPTPEERGTPCLHSLILNNTKVPSLKTDVWLLKKCLQELSPEAGCSWSAAPNKAMASAPAEFLQAMQSSLVWQSPCRSRTLALLKLHPFTLLLLKMKWKLYGIQPRFSSFMSASSISKSGTPPFRFYTFYDDWAHHIFQVRLSVLSSLISNIV